MRSSSLAWSEVLSLNLSSWAECLGDVRSLVRLCMWQKECYFFFFFFYVSCLAVSGIPYEEVGCLHAPEHFFCSTIKMSWLCDRLASGINRLHNEIWTVDKLPVPWRFPSWVNYLAMSQSHLRVTLKQTVEGCFLRLRWSFYLRSNVLQEGNASYRAILVDKLLFSVKIILTL